MKTRRGTDERSKLVRSLDRITPKIVKIRDAYTCQKCGKMPVVRGCHWAHFYSRRDFLLRWNLLNAVTLCYGCHSFLDGNPHIFEDWLDEKYPSRGPYLRALRAQPRSTIKSETLKQWLAEHRDKLAELEAEFNVRV